MTSRMATISTAIFLAVSAPQQTQGQILEVAKGAATSVVIDQLFGSLNGLVDNARQSGDFLAMRAAQEALYVLDAFKATNSELLDQAFDAIGKERQAFLNDVNRIVGQIEAGRVDTLERLQQTGDQFDRLTRDVTFKEFPVLFRYRGSVVTPGETTDIRLVVEGHRLTRGEPYLTFRGKQYPAKIDGEALRFDLPRALFVAAADKPNFEEASLTVENREGGFLGWFQTVSQKEYNLSLVTLPKTVATVTLSYNEISAVPQERAFQEEVSHNSSSRNWNCRPFVYSPAAGDRRFDVTRSSVQPHSGNSRGQLRNPQVRDVGISFELCARRGTFDGDNGFRHAIVRYVEVWTTSQSQPQTVSEQLSWTASTTVRMPADFNGLTIDVRDFNGVSRTVTEAGGITGRFASVRYDAESRVVIVDPLAPAFVGAL